MLPYTAEIFQLSTEIPNLGRLPPPALTVTAVSPICGSRMTLSVLIAAGQVVRFAWDVEACALGQASAALIGKRVVGWGASEINDTAQALEKFLKSADPVPTGYAWLAPLIPARAVPQRHGSILLPLRVFQKAFSQEHPQPGM